MSTAGGSRGQTGGSEASGAEEGKAVRSGQWTPSSRPLFRTSVCVLGGDWPPGGGGAGPASQPPHALWRVLQDCRVPTN